MHSFKQSNLQAPFKGQMNGTTDGQRLKEPTFTKLVPQMQTRKEDLLRGHSDRLKMRHQGPTDGMDRQEDVNGTNRPAKKASLIISKKIEDQPKIDKQRVGEEYHGEMIKDMRSEKSSFGPPGRMTKGKYPRNFVCNRASGLSGSPQVQQSLISSNDSEMEICRVCLEEYSWEDQRVFTRCCEMAIGSQCKAQHIAEYGGCWNCGKEEIPSEAGSEAGSWAPYDPKDYEGEQPAFPSTDDAGRNPATAKVEAGSVLPSGSSFGGQDSSNPSSNTRMSGSSQIAQHLSGNREAAMHKSQSGKEWSKTPGATPQSSYNLTDRQAKSYCITDKGSTITTESQRSLYDGSESSSSALFQDDQQHVRPLTSRTFEQPEAKQYVIEATNHLVEMCDVYIDGIDDELMNEMIKILAGCKVFKAAIDKQTSESASAPSSQQASTQSPALVDASNPKSSEGESYCSKCEELESRMNKVAEALLGG